MNTGSHSLDDKKKTPMRDAALNLNFKESSCHKTHSAVLVSGTAGSSNHCPMADKMSWPSRNNTTTTVIQTAESLQIQMPPHY